MARAKLGETSNMLDAAVPLIPVLDLMAFLSTNVKLIRQICYVCGMPFKGRGLCSAIAALLSKP